MAIKPTTQAGVVLEALKLGPMTSMEAFQDFGITRLAARIDELRRAGYDIRTEMLNTTNRLGGRCNFAKYHLTSSVPKVLA